MNIATIWIQTKISRIMNIPQGYKQTELGIIPEDWEVKSFSQIFDMYPNNTYPRDCMNDSCGVVRNIHYGDVLIKYPTIVDVEKCAIPYLNENVKIKLQKLVQSGDIIIADTAEDETVGKCVEIKNVGNNKIVAGLHTFFCRPTAPFAAGWLGYYINSTNYHNQLIPYITGIKVSSISRTSIQETKLLVPPIAEQRTIAEALSDVDGLIAALDKKIAKKRLLKQGAMQQLLTGKKRLLGFTDEWVDTPIGEGVRFQVGYPFQSQYFTSDRIGKRLVKNRDLKSNDQIVFYNGEYEHKFIVHNGDILIGMDGDFLPYKWDKGIALLNQRVGRLLPTKKWDLSFVMYALIEPLQKLQDGTGATTVKHLSHNDIEQMVLCIPQNYEEQQAIATILSDMDKEIADFEAQRDKYRLLKSGMMQKLLTGQIRLVKQQAKIVPLGVEVPAVREIPIDAHIIAGHIVNRSHQSRGWGRTKLQKSLHLIGYCTQLNLGNEYIRNTAGPDDQQLMNYIDQKFKQYRHVNKVCEKLPDGKTHYSYTPTPMIQDVEMAYEKYPKELREQVDALIDKLNTMDLAGAEMLSTLYAVWNNRIIKQEQIRDDLLIADFYAWSTHKADFEEARVRKALNYMRDNNIIPVGWGKYIDKR